MGQWFRMHSLRPVKSRVRGRRRCTTVPANSRAARMFQASTVPASLLDALEVDLGCEQPVQISEPRCFRLATEPDDSVSDAESVAARRLQLQWSFQHHGSPCQQHRRTQQKAMREIRPGQTICGGPSGTHQRWASHAVYVVNSGRR